MEVPDYGPYADRPWPDTEKGFAAMVTRLDDEVGMLGRVQTRLIASPEFQQALRARDQRRTR